MDMLWFSSGGGRSGEIMFYVILRMLEYTSKETAAPLISVAAALWLSKFSGEKLNILDFFLKILKMRIFFINTSHNFQSKRQNMTSGVVCNYRV